MCCDCLPRQAVKDYNRWRLTAWRARGSAAWRLEPPWFPLKSPAATRLEQTEGHASRTLPARCWTTNLKCLLGEEKSDNKTQTNKQKNPKLDFLDSNWNPIRRMILRHEWGTWSHGQADLCRCDCVGASTDPTAAEELLTHLINMRKNQALWFESFNHLQNSQTFV